MVDQGLLDRLRAVLESAEGLRLALLFGSRARGTASADADIDLAVLGSNLDHIEMSRAVSEAVDVEVDVVDLTEAGYPLLRSVLRDAVLVLERHPGELASWRARTIAQLETDRPWFERMRTAFLDRLSGASVGRP